jgi:hypothetical protein
MNKSLCFAILLVLPALCLQSGNSAGKRNGNAENSEDDVPVLCPALEAAIGIHLNAPIGEDVRQPELVVVVHPVKIGKDMRGLDKHRYEVQKVLYGSYSEKTIELNDFYPRSETCIVAVVQSLYAEQPGFNVRYSLPGSDQKAEMALCQARLDYFTLAAHSIFIGAEVSADKDFFSTVAVARTIHGADIKPDSRILVQSTEQRFLGMTIQLRPETHIYFISRIVEDKDGKHYDLLTRLPLECEKSVKEALARRDQYSIREGVVDGWKMRYREITFRGSNAEAIDLLGASGEGAVSLGFQTLKYRRKDAQPDIVAAIEREMFEFAPQEPGRFKRLHQLIKLLETMCGEDKKYDSLVQLTDKYVAYIKGTPKALPKYEAPPPHEMLGLTTEENRTDINRSFTWLLMALGEERACERYGTQLLALREQVRDAWEREVQVALDALRVEETTDLAAAMARMKEIRPIRSLTGSRLSTAGLGISAVAFSPDGNLFASAGDDGKIRLWNTADWSPASTIEQGGSIKALAFSPDSRLIYVAGGDPVRFNAATGKIDKTYDSHHKGVCDMAVSPDGKTVAASSDFEDLIFF